MAFQMDCITHKKTNNMKKLIFIFLALCLGISLEAYDFKSGDLCYNIISNAEPYEVAVTNKSTSWGYNYSFVSVEIPEYIEYNGIQYTITTIGRSAFYSCTNLTSIVIGANVKTIEDQAFEECYSLTNITIGRSVNKIANNAFFAAPLSVVMLKSEIPPTIGGVYNAQYGGVQIGAISTKPTCHIPCGLLDAYKNSAWVNVASSFIEDSQFQANIESNDISMGNVEKKTTLDCNVIAIFALPTNGYKFVKWSDGNTQATRYLELTEDISLTAYFAKEGYTIHVYQDCNTTIE